MTRQPINIEDLNLQPHFLFHHRSVLLTSGDYLAEHFNAMTIGWGALGTMWSRPFAFVAVRHSRYTYQFMEKYDSFTVSAFPEQYHETLKFLGSRSGRDGDKIAASGLNPEASVAISAPSFKEAELVLECRKIYADDLNPAHFLDETIENHYPSRDYHCIYYGEIIAVTGIEKYRA
ncbi:MAG TPA: flavin reductase [Brevefilum sp.]|nr:flavin reductase [Brevefilum sp.]HPL69655.1 flavin reductase [Brevefilum sp.]